MIKKATAISTKLIAQNIYLIRRQKVMLDSDLAELYGVPTKVFNQAVRRNRKRFPTDFMFELTPQETSALRSQFVTLENGRGRYSKYSPMAFTEQGVAMLSSVLHSERAIAVNIAIMRAFVRLREMLATNRDLARKLETMEQKYDAQFQAVFKIIKALTKPPPEPAEPEKPPIGFRV